MAPPLVAELPLSVLLTTLSTPPLLTMSPPSVAELPLMLVLTTTSDPPFAMPPPLIERPLTIARSWISVFAPMLTRNGWVAPPPSTTVWAGPLPTISTSLVVLRVPALEAWRCRWWRRRT